jgi:hypothetical protein
MKEDTKPEPETESDVQNFGSEKDVMIRLMQKLESAQLIKFALRVKKVCWFPKRSEEEQMTRVSQFIFTVLMLMLPAPALAGPSEDANAAVSPVMSEGTQAIVKYFTPIKGTGNKNTIDERRTIAIGDNAVLVTGFYTFTRMVEGKPVPGPSRFTMLVTKRGGEWRLAHHHSSPLVLTKN